MRVRSNSALEAHSEIEPVSQAIAMRIAQVSAEMPAAQLARLCHCSGESARRYRLGATAPATFLHHFCRSFNVDGHWLLTGEDMPPRCHTALQRCSTDTLLEELHRRLQLDR